MIYVNEASLKQTATDFFDRKDLRQKLRRELLFGLFSMTLIGKSSRSKFILNFVSAGEEQRHLVHNAFNILVNEGLMRDEQEVYTLEVVQKFYEIIQEPKSNKGGERFALTMSTWKVYTRLSSSSNLDL